MTGEKTLPVWLAPATIEGWATRTVTSERLGYEVALPESWADAPTTTEYDTHVEEVWAGALPLEGLAVQRLTGADPSGELATWVTGTLRLTQLPVTSDLFGPGASVELVAWSDLGGAPALAARDATDEAHLFEGLVRAVGKPDLARLYIVLARRDDVAWNLALSLSSACPPGTLDEIVTVNDHARAAAVWASLSVS